MKSELSGCQRRPDLAPHSSGEHGGIRDEDSAQDSMRERRRQGQRNSRDGQCIVVSALSSWMERGSQRGGICPEASDVVMSRAGVRVL